MYWSRVSAYKDDSCIIVSTQNKMHYSWRAGCLRPGVKSIGMTLKRGNNQRLRIQNVNENVRCHSGFLNKEGLCISSLPDQRFQETVGFTLKHFANKISFIQRTGRSGRRSIHQPGLLKDRKKKTSSQIQSLVDKQHKTPISRSSVNRRRSCGVSED